MVNLFLFLDFVLICSPYSFFCVVFMTRLKYCKIDLFYVILFLKKSQTISITRDFEKKYFDTTYWVFPWALHLHKILDRTYKFQQMCIILMKFPTSSILYIKMIDYIRFNHRITEYLKFYHF